MAYIVMAYTPASGWTALLQACTYGLYSYGLHTSKWLVAAGVDSLDWIPFGFFQYHSIGINTHQNLGPLLSGYSDWSPRGEHGHGKAHPVVNPVGWDMKNGLVGFFHAAGYVTSAFMEQSLPHQMPYWRDCSNSDHRFSFGAEDLWADVMSESVTDRVCFGDRTKFEIFEDYFKQLMAAYTPLPIFAYSHFQSADHFPDGRALRVFDPTLMRILSASFDSSTDLVLVMGDHGWHFGTFYRTDYGLTDHKFPVMLWLTPAQFLTPAHARALQTNQHRLVTIHDVGVTLKGFAAPAQDLVPHPGNSDEAVFGRSLLLPLPESRSCSSAGIPPHICMLDGVRAAEISKPWLDSLTTNLIRTINHRVSETAGACLSLPPATQWYARATITSADYSETESIRVVVTLSYDSSNGRCSDPLSFAGVFEKERDTPIVSSLVRISKYAHETCIRELPKEIGQFCVCRDGNVFR